MANMTPLKCWVRFQVDYVFSLCGGGVNVCPTSMRICVCDGDHVAFYLLLLCCWGEGKGYWRKSSHSAEWRQNRLRWWVSERSTEIKKKFPLAKLSHSFGRCWGIGTISPVGDSRRLSCWSTQGGGGGYDDDGNGEIVILFIFAGRVTSSSVLFWPRRRHFSDFHSSPSPLWRSCVCVCVYVWVADTPPPPILPNCRV